MERRLFLSRVFGQGFLGATALWSTGCGTVLHPERRGQPHSNQIDWKIVALDGLGLILFFVPGVVAFAVDFCTGAIYLPMEEAYPSYGAHTPVNQNRDLQQDSISTIATTSATPAQPIAARLGLRRVAVPREQLNVRRVEQVAAHHVGRPVALDHHQARLSTLARIDVFEHQLNRHHADGTFGHPVRSFFERWNRG